MEAILLVGIAGCGKTTFCQKYISQHTRIALDDIPKHNRNTQDRLVEQALAEGKNIVIDDTNLTKKIRSRHITLAQRFGAAIKAVYFDLPMQKIQIQNRRRDVSLESHIIFHMKKQLEPPSYDEGFDFIQIIRE